MRPPSSLPRRCDADSGSPVALDSETFACAAIGACNVNSDVILVTAPVATGDIDVPISKNSGAGSRVVASATASGAAMVASGAELAVGIDGVVAIVAAVVGSGLDAVMLAGP